MQGPTSKAKHRFVGAAATEWSVTGEQTPRGPLSRPCFFCHIDSNMIIQAVANVFLWTCRKFRYHFGGAKNGRLREKFWTATMHYKDKYIWETSKSAVVETLFWGAIFCLESGSKPWKPMWWTTKSDTLRCIVLKNNWFIHVCVQSLELFLFFPNCRQSPFDTRSDTFAIPFWCMNAHESILFLDAWEKISWCPPHMACIEQESKIWPGHHEHRQFQFDIYIYI